MPQIAAIHWTILDYAFASVTGALLCIAVLIFFAFLWSVWRNRPHQTPDEGTQHFFDHH